LFHFTPIQERQAFYHIVAEKGKNAGEFFLHLFLSSVDLKVLSIKPTREQVFTPRGLYQK